MVLKKFLLPIWLKYLIFNFTYKSKIGNVFSENNLSNIVYEILRDKYSGFYIEIGANDGITQSNTILLEKRNNWSGILIEPGRKNYNYCVKYRSENNSVINELCGSFEDENNQACFIDLDLMSFVRDKKSLLKDFKSHAREGRKHSRNNNLYKTQYMKIVSLDSILKKNNSPKYIDFLSLDTEGYELEILKGLNFQEYSFGCILIEVREKAVIDYMRKQKYEIWQQVSHHDYIFQRCI